MGFINQLLSRIVETEETTEPLRDKSRRELENLQTVVLTVTKPHQIELKLSNISLSGMGLLLPHAFELGQLGDRVSGVLAVGSETCTIDATIVHLDEDIAGCRVDGNGEAFRSLIKSYYLTGLETVKMRHVKPDIIKPVADGDVVWLMGKNNCELYYVVKDDCVIRFHLIVYGNYISGGKEIKPTFGYVSGHQPDSTSQLSVVDHVDAFSPETKYVAINAVLGTKRIVEAHKRQIIDFLEPMEPTQVGKAAG